MKRIIFFVIVTFIFIFKIQSQEIDETKDYIYTKHNRIIYAKNVRYKTPFLGTGYFMVDSVKYKSSYVKFYKNLTGFHANTYFYPGINLSGGGFAERVSKGKINLFKKEVSGYNMGHMGPNGMMMSGGHYHYTIQYYNKDFGELKKAKYRNLVLDLADNSNSMEFLQKHKRSRNTAAGFFIAGGTIVLAGLVGLVSKTSNIDVNAPEPDVSRNLTLMAVGAGSAMVGSIIYFATPNHIQDAIDEYNRE